MTHSIYKYAPPDVLDLMFARDDLCGIKCSHPKDYNDPYELFLSVDLSGSSDLLAIYREIVQELPQYPTTCFSKAPTVAPMWAHYAQNHTGFVLELDADAMEHFFEDVRIKDVTYREDPDPNIEFSLKRAAGTKKPRHAMWLRGEVIGQAYYSKLSAWQYEQECRLVASNDDVEDVSGHMILFVPVDCLSSIIVGNNAPEALVKRTKEIAEKYDLEWLQSKIGKSTSLPFFTTKDGAVRTFHDGQIAAANNICGTCSEPIDDEEELCPWCKITDEDAYVAAQGNPLRVLDHFGMLDDYLESVEAIERVRRKRKK